MTMTRDTTSHGNEGQRQRQGGTTTRRVLEGRHQVGIGNFNLEGDYLRLVKLFIPEFL
jgi:hypothetical protein